MKTNSEIALCALLMGLTIDLPGYPLPIKLAKPGDELTFPSTQGEAVQYMLVYCMADGRHLGCELDLAAFVAAAQQIDDAQRVHLCASLTLATERRKTAH